MNFRRFLKGWKIPLFYLGLLISNFGIYIPWWGLYGDDWQYLYSFHVFGAGGYPAFVAADRPYSAWVYMLLTPLLGEHAWAYHLVLLLLRWVSGLLFFKVVQALWPRREEIAFWAGAVLVMYPGFKQQPLPLEFILHFSILNLTLFSLFCMLRETEAKQGGWKWTLSGVISALGIFSVEYFTGLELLRPVMLWVKLKGSHPHWRARLLAVLKKWLPYLMVFLGFLFWRIFVFQFQHYKPSLSGASNPLKLLMNTGWKAFDSIWLALVESWEISIDIKWGLPAAFLQLAALFLSFFALYLIIRRIYPKVPAAPPEPVRDYLWYPTIGLTAIALAGPLYWVLDIPIQQEFPWDRPLLSFIPGVAILLGVVIVRMVIPKYRSILLAGLCAVTILANFHNARSYLEEWTAVRSYVSQLTQRAPQLEPGTILLTQNLPFVYYGENTFFPILNWVYQPENHSSQMRVRMFDLSIRQGDAVAQLERGETIKQDYRSFAFQSNREKVVAYTYQPPACLHILAPGEADYPYLQDWLKDLVFLSKPEMIQTTAESPTRLPAVMGSPVTNTWCAAYETAELARQKQDWEQIRQIAVAAQRQGLKPAVGYEYLPFIEAFARGSDWQRAGQYFQLAKSTDPVENSYLCSRWANVADALKEDAANQLTQAYCSQ